MYRVIKTQAVVHYMRFSWGPVFTLFAPGEFTTKNIPEVILPVNLNTSVDLVRKMRHMMFCRSLTLWLDLPSMATPLFRLNLLAIAQPKKKFEIKWKLFNQAWIAGTFFKVHCKVFNSEHKKIWWPSLKVLRIAQKPLKPQLQIQMSGKFLREYH